MQRMNPACWIVCLFAMMLLAVPLQARELGLEERIRAQEAIERVYYSHQIGATRPFPDAVPRELLEKKVLTYLKQSVALEEIWHTPVSSLMLRRELERIVRQTRRPDRLREIFKALGDDPFLIQECLARPAVVSRLVRNFSVVEETALEEKLPRAGADSPDRAPASGQDWEQWWAGVERRFDAHAVKAVAMGDMPRAVLSSPESGSHDCTTDSTWDNSSLNRLPDARSGATAVWTGSLMLVWGGSLGDNNLSKTGGRYDPATDTWTPISIQGAPDARHSHAAVWTGTEMIVWGGFTGYVPGPGTGGRYNPLSDTWTVTSTVNAPSNRQLLSAVWTGSRMVIWGGLFTNVSSVVNTGGRYDPSSDSWEATSTVNAPSAAYRAAAVWTGNLMLVWSGTQPVPGGRYDPVSDVWSSMSTANAPGGGPAVWTGDRMLVVKDDGTFAGGRYDPATDTWTKMGRTGAPPLDRSGSSVVWTGSRMILWGGYQSSTGTNPSTGGVYDPVSDSWTATSTTNVPMPRTAHQAIWTGSLMIVWGGASNYARLNTGGRYDPVTDSWTPTSVLGAPPNRAWHTAVWTGNLMLVWGGVGANSFHNYSFPNTGGRYDPALDEWAATSLVGAPSGRYSHTAVWTGAKMIIWGGTDGSDTWWLNTGGRYDPIADTWQPTSTLGAPMGRSDPAAVWTGTKMILWGGVNPSGRLNDGSRYDPDANSWQPISSLGAPPGSSGALAFWTGSRMLVWGGAGDYGLINTGGRYDPFTDQWLPISIVNAPDAIPERYTPFKGAWTGSRMLVWGSDTGGGQYDPAADTWTHITSPPGDVQKEGESVVWTGSRMIVWGGGISSTLEAYWTVNNSGGIYDPGTDSWTLTPVSNAPAPRAGHTAVWAGDTMVVWGGLSDPQSETQMNTGGRFLFGMSVDDDGDSFAECTGDCNDASAAVHPGATEVCNGVDDDCSLVIDDAGGSLCGDGDACTADLCGGASGCLHPPRDIDADTHGDALCGGDDCNDSNAGVWHAPVEVTQLTLTAPSPANPSWSGQAGLAGPATVYDLVSGLMGPAPTPNFASAACLQSTSATSYVDARPNPASGTAFWYLARGRNACATGTYGSAPRDAAIPSCP